ncbi:hypothetical protein HYE66_05995 [Aggregatibacter actinomycetemcomitans]|nr:hypothetical protein [Aggregatibacter actinomycetemcomitans]
MDSSYSTEPNPKQCYIRAPATIKPLVNGETAFGTLHDYLAKAKHSIEIAIWGFQPSMFFKRDGYSPCIGDLLIQKALEGVQVKVLVWSMDGAQTFTEANLGNMPFLPEVPFFSAKYQKRREEGVTDEQMDYDYWWYMAVAGFKSRPQYRVTDASAPFDAAYSRLHNFANSSQCLNLQFKTRRIEEQQNDYVDNTLPASVKGTLAETGSHHQKTVLIDFAYPERAVGFVMEHNMVDNYWDTSFHKMETVRYAPNEGRHTPTPLQDVSSLVTGIVLKDLDRNFCESWNRENNQYFPLQHDAEQSARDAAYKTPLERTALSLDYKGYPKPEGCVEIEGQILRTYDKPDVENIKEVYLRNIIKVSSFLYTENQYFRWPPLVDKFKQHWQSMKAMGRDDTTPIFWFVVTNSSDAGIGAGTATTDTMLGKLGRQDVMPNVALKKVISQQIVEKERVLRGYQEAVEESENEGIKAKAAALEEDLDKLKRTAEEAKTRPEALYRDVTDEIGIKSHICTLVANEDAIEQALWQEVYVHSKVTIMDDLFTFIGSVNLNTRSMQQDSELGIISESQKVALNLRRELWGLHTKGNTEANPEEPLHCFGSTEKVFDAWKRLLERNKQEKSKGNKPLYPLQEFFRASDDISRLD